MINRTTWKLSPVLRIVHRLSLSLRMSRLLGSMDVCLIHGLLPWNMASLALHRIVLPELPAVDASPRCVLGLHCFAQHT